MTSESHPILSTSTLLCSNNQSEKLDPSECFCALSRDTPPLCLPYHFLPFARGSQSSSQSVCNDGFAIAGESSGQFTSALSTQRDWFLPTTSYFCTFASDIYRHDHVPSSANDDLQAIESHRQVHTSQPDCTARKCAIATPFTPHEYIATFLERLT